MFKKLKSKTTLSHSTTGKGKRLPLELLVGGVEGEEEGQEFVGDLEVTVEHYPPLFGGWWGKRFGLAPSKAITARRPRRIIGAGGKQKYNDITDACKKEGILWEDPAFPATDANVFFSREPPHPFEWKRPHEIHPTPEFITAGASRFDVRQGELGDCWLLAAVANMTLHKSVVQKVVPPDQTFDKAKGYCGVFKFKFWQYGTWIEVVIDDRLPTFDGKLMFMHSGEKNEFWSALLEKAYAKLQGSYEALKGGSCSEAMEDFTGGLAEVFDLKGDDVPKNAFGIMRKALDRCSMMGCSLDGDPNVFEAKQDNGLIRGHAYSVTDVKQVTVTLPNKKKGEVQLVRIRNPWGNAVEWKGAWSDNSPEWTCISKSERNKLGLTFAADGEFWMCFADFLASWHKVEICHLGPETTTALDNAAAKGHHNAHHSHVSWSSQSFDGSWVKGATAGGCRNFLSNSPHTFAYNPQYKITLKDPDDDDDNLCTCVVALMQKHRRKMREMGIAELLTIGYAVYKVEDSELLSRPLSKHYFASTVSVARTQAYVNLREVCCRFKLPPGNYVIVPTTFSPNEEGEFMVRVFSEKQATLEECDEHTHFSNQPQSPPSAEQPISNGHAAADVHDKGDQLAEYFTKLAGSDLEIDAWELQVLLTYAMKRDFKFDKFQLDTCRSMIACVDLSRTGKLDVEEFKELWSTIRTWKFVFRAHDKDGSGSISSYELRDALRKVGYHLNSRILKTLVLRYANENSQISFDNFIGCAVKLKTMLEIYGERDPKNSGTASFTMGDWVELTMYA